MEGESLHPQDYSPPQADRDAVEGSPCTLTKTLAH